MNKWKKRAELAESDVATLLVQIKELVTEVQHAKDYVESTATAYENERALSDQLAKVLRRISVSEADIRAVALASWEEARSGG